MKAGTILYHGADLALYGSPRFTLRRSPDPAPPARATRQRVDIAVRVELRADMPATVWARARALQALLKSQPEGLLEIQDENGTAVSWMAKPGENSLPEAIQRGSGAVEMTFTAMEQVADGDHPLVLRIDPLDGGEEIHMGSPQQWNMNVRINRPDEISAHRDLVASGITFSAKAAHANPLDTAPARAEFLIAKAEELNALSGKQARLRFHGFDQVVQMENFTAKPNEGWDWLDIEAQCRYVMLPGETEAEVNFSEESAEDPATGEIRTTISGTVRAPDKTTSDTKINALIAGWNAPSRRIVRITRGNAYLDGEDSPDSPDWISARFSVEYAESGGGSNYTLQVQTTEGPDGNRISYSGSATATSLGGLLTIVDSASKNKHPVEIRYELTVEYATTSGGSLRLIQGRFLREYQVASTVIRGNATRSTSKGAFGDWQVTVTGSLTGSSAATARAIARTFIDPTVNLRTDDEAEAKTVYGADEQFTTLNFNYAWGLTHSRTSLEYDDTETPDYTKMTNLREFSGTVWAASRGAAESAALALGASLGTPTRQSFTHSMESDSTSRYQRTRFSLAYESKLSGTIGHDIIEASFSLQRIGQVNHVPITEIPLGTPLEQIPFGYTIGRTVASGTVKARLRSTAVAWGQSKRAQAAMGTGREDPPDERVTESYAPFSGADATCYQFDFQYSFRHASGLTGLMTP